MKGAVQELPPKNAGKKRTNKKRRKAPTTAAVTLFCEDGRYADILRGIKARFTPSDIGIQDLRVRVGITGA